MRVQRPGRNVVQYDSVMARADMARGGAALPWWNPDGATPGGIGGTCVGAYQAKSAASYAASLSNLANPGTNDLTEGNGAVPWAALTGWGFINAAAQYFKPGTVPQSTWSMLVQYANSSPVLIGNYYLCGIINAGRVIAMRPYRTGNAVSYRNGGDLDVSPALLTGNLGMAGQTGYRNGASEGAIPVGGGVNAGAIFLGCVSNAGAPIWHIEAQIWAYVLYNTTLTAPQMLARATAMAAL